MQCRSCRVLLAYPTAISTRSSHSGTALHETYVTFIFNIYLYIHSLFWIALSMQCTGLPRGPDD